MAKRSAEGTERKVRKGRGGKEGESGRGGSREREKREEKRRWQHLPSPLAALAHSGSFAPDLAL